MLRKFEETIGTRVAIFANEFPGTFLSICATTGMIIAGVAGLVGRLIRKKK